MRSVFVDVFKLFGGEPGAIPPTPETEDRVVFADHNRGNVRPGAGCQCATCERVRANNAVL